jgi:hypothetical protein
LEVSDYHIVIVINYTGVSVAKADHAIGRQHIHTTFNCSQKYFIDIRVCCESRGYKLGCFFNCISESAENSLSFLKIWQIKVLINRAELFHLICPVFGEFLSKLEIFIFLSIEVLIA